MVFIILVVFSVMLMNIKNENELKNAIRIILSVFDLIFENQGLSHDAFLIKMELRDSIIDSFYEIYRTNLKEVK